MIDFYVCVWFWFDFCGCPLYSMASPSPSRVFYSNFYYFLLNFCLATTIISTTMCEWWEVHGSKHFFKFPNSDYKFRVWENIIWISWILFKIHPCTNSKSSDSSLSTIDMSHDLIRDQKIRFIKVQGIQIILKT